MILTDKIINDVNKKVIYRIEDIRHDCTIYVYKGNTKEDITIERYHGKGITRAVELLCPEIDKKDYEKILKVIDDYNKQFDFLL